MASWGDEAPADEERTTWSRLMSSLWALLLRQPAIYRIVQQEDWATSLTFCALIRFFVDWSGSADFFDFQKSVSGRF